MDNPYLILNPEQTAELLTSVNISTAEVAGFILDAESEPAWGDFLRGFDQGRLQGIVDTMNAVLGTHVNSWDVVDYFRRVREEG